MGYVNEFKTRGKSESNSLSGRKTMTPQHISSGAGKAKAKMPTVRPIRQSGYLGQYPRVSRYLGIPPGAYALCENFDTRKRVIAKRCRPRQTCRTPPDMSDFAVPGRI